MRYSKGIMWLDNCRIPFVDEGDIKSATPGSLNATGEHSLFHIKNDRAFINQQGRFTPNLLVCDDMLNDGTITKATAAGKKGKSGFVNGYQSGDYDIPYGDKGTNSRYYDLDKWFDKVIDEIQ